ncbi:MAG: XRE family transcriptional regulator [Candidatus Yanofskybacteria bacterium]|nr:XRE family transcriptional regulator [Candidatus Yanofskybacteria bacterium]
MSKIDLKELAEFLNEANKSTYANRDVPKATSSRLKSEDYHFEKDSLIYHDTYFGSRDFIGEEIVYKDNEPVWGMNYYGYILSETTNEKELYGFLRQALMQEYSDIIPVRGPTNFQDRDWEYSNSADGELGRFIGVEEIYRAGVLVYKGYYHGGFIK